MALFGRKAANPEGQEEQVLLHITAGAGLILDNVRGYKKRKIGKKGLINECRRAMGQIREALDRL